MPEQEMDIAYVIGKRIKAGREKCDLSQEELASKCVPALSVVYLSEIERGKKNITVIRLRSVAIALNVSMDYLTAMPNTEQSSDND